MEKHLNMNNLQFYTTDYISGVMSLRKPQAKSLEILDNILKNVAISKKLDLKTALNQVNKQYPICTNFERDFMSLSFVLATGVGKTRLMGTFITYLYTNHNIKNFFIVAPGTTVYNKLKKDLGDVNSPKYVFKGVGCFEELPRIIADDDYRTKRLDFSNTGVNICIFNISKFDKENVKMKAVNEVLGDSFYNELSKLNDLVIIMDESHHYHADKGATALNELKPVLGLELTATPYYNKGSKQIKFKNAVYEYPLSNSISDGYTRTPYAVTRRNINSYNFGDEELDKIMLSDGILCHERIKLRLENYAKENGERLVKPFMMVVCKDTDHATKVHEYVTSDAFCDGKYKNKTLLIHSNQSKAVREANVEKLLNLESPENTVEIVIHVDMLKEGWDVNNLYTIVPLRTASSKILREQMIGRGLRLPYGKRTGVKEIDSVMLTAHDKFEEILKEAQSGESIFNAGNVIEAENLQEEKFEVTQLNLDLPDENTDRIYEKTGLERNNKNTEFIKTTQNIISEKVANGFFCYKKRTEMPDMKKIASEVVKTINADKDLAVVYKTNENTLFDFVMEEVAEFTRKTAEKFIPIPQIKVTEAGIEEYNFVDFDLDLSEFNHVPISNELLIQNLQETGDLTTIEGQYIDFDGFLPKKKILELLREKAEIDYERCSNLLFKLITQAVEHYSAKYGENGMKNIVMMNKRDVANKIYYQMIKEGHFYVTNGLLQEEIVDISRQNLPTSYDYKFKKDLFQEPQETIGSNLFCGIKKGVFGQAKFDSKPELVFARVVEKDKDVANWLRPNPNEFKIYYNNGKRYEPDFVVETAESIYLVEVKGENMLNDPDVIAKKERAEQYCKIASEWGKANNYKDWKYLFIPAGQIQSNSSFMNLAQRFGVLAFKTA